MLWDVLQVPLEDRFLFLANFDAVAPVNSPRKVGG